jgi:hypothetical protein
LNLNFPNNFFIEISFPIVEGAQQQQQQQQVHQYQNINPNIHTGLISSTGRNPTFPSANQMDTSNGKMDDKQAAAVYDIGAGTTGHPIPMDAKSGTATTFIDTTMLNAMQAMFSPIQQQQQPQQFRSQSHLMFHNGHPTTAPTSTPQLYFN